jgi:putative heme-binding domain-containing protein
MNPKALTSESEYHAALSKVKSLMDAAPGSAAEADLELWSLPVESYESEHFPTGTQGLQVGPDLVTVKTKGREGIFTAILDPNKEVAPQYIAYTVNTKDGQTLAGIITNDSANSMTLKMMGGAEMNIPRSNIKGSTSTGASLMPEGIESGMSVQDMADLLEFIEGLN